ncbi:unnamed protein product, partial [Allacma fusca]
MGNLMSVLRSKFELCRESLRISQTLTQYEVPEYSNDYEHLYNQIQGGDEAVVIEGLGMSKEKAIAKDQLIV